MAKITGKVCLHTSREAQKRWFGFQENLGHWTDLGTLADIYCFNTTRRTAQDQGPLDSIVLGIITCRSWCAPDSHGQLLRAAEVPIDPGGKSRDDRLEELSSPPGGAGALM